MSQNRITGIFPSADDARKLFSMPSASDDVDPSAKYPKPLASLSSECCAQCGGKVYQVEKVGPVNQVIFHKGCFKCSQCGQNLTLKSYFTNPMDQSDKLLYCGKHCPKVATQGVDANAFGIRAALKAPAAGLQSSVNEVIRWSGDVPRIDLDARYIKGALLAQSEFERKYMLNNKHHFPVWVGESKKKLLKYQEELERRQREEEDRLVMAFHDERIREAENMEKEIKEEWELNLKKLMGDFESKNRRKENFSYDEKVDQLTKTMTVKRASKMQALTLKLQSKAQEKTADMVKKHSEEMLTLLHVKHQELKKELDIEIKSSGAENSLALAETMTSMSLLAEIPDAHPPRIRKRDLYHDPSVFAELDEEVFKVAKTDQCTFTELVDQLTANCTSDLEKARAIFRWITVKDLNVMEFSETVKQDTPLGLLRGIKFGTETYHSLFMRLCSYAGLICKEVKGHSKSVGYEPGMKIHSDAFLNSWTVILIAGDWWPVQCNWAARHLVMNREAEAGTKERQTGSKRSRDKIRYEYDEHYFLTDPDEFIMEFWANDAKWQLLEVPISMEEFEAMPFVRSVFFNNGLEFADRSKRSILETNASGVAEIEINMPSELKKDLVFHYHLRFADRERRREVHFNGVKLERYVLHTISEQLILFSVHVPAPGSYFLEIFVNRIDENSKNQNIDALLQELRLKGAAKLRIDCKQITGKMLPLPNCAPGEWGPLRASRYFGITCLSHQVGVINGTNELAVRLKLPRWMTVMAELHFNGVDKKELKRFIDLQIDDQLVATIKVSFPRKGQFGLDIYSNVENNDSSVSLTHICKFLINCTHVSNPIELPTTNSQNLARDKLARQSSYLTSQSSQSKAIENEYTLPAAFPSRRSDQNVMESPKEVPVISDTPRTLPEPLQDPNNIPLPGPMPAFKLYGVKCISHKSPEIYEFEKQGEVTIEMSCSSQEFKLIPKLIRETPYENWSHQVNAKETSKKFKFHVSLPGYGTYWLIISAQNLNKPQSCQSEVYAYLLYHSEYGSVKKRHSLLKK